MTSARATSVGAIAMAASISRSVGGTICMPPSRNTLYPLSAGGLCDAVIWTPAAAP
jgi:hypothetical protein